MAKKVLKFKKAVVKITELRDFQKFKLEALEEGCKKWTKEYHLYLQYDCLVHLLNDHNDGSKILG